MKKLFWLCIPIILLTGCFGGKQGKWEKEMQKHATIYYESYMKPIEGQIKNDISISALKNVNKQEGGKFDLRKLSSCKDSSYVTITVDEKTRKIKEYTYYMDCK